MPLNLNSPRRILDSRKSHKFTVTGLRRDHFETTHITEIASVLLSNRVSHVTLRIGLAEFPADLCSISTLTRLDLSYNRLTSLPSSISRLQGLVELNVEGNRLTELPSALGALTSLQSLILSSNHLRGLPSTIGQLENSLRELNMSQNVLHELPPEISQLTSLTALHAAHNQLTTVPDSACLLFRLSALNLAHNYIQYLPTAMVTLRFLAVLDVTGNRLTVLPAHLWYLPSLSSLLADGNEIASIEPPQMDVSPSLVTLSLEQNLIRVLPQGLARARGLGELRLARNPLACLPPDLALLTNLSVLTVDTSTISIPSPETVNKGLKAVREYLMGLGKAGVISDASVEELTMHVVDSQTKMDIFHKQYTVYVLRLQQGLVQWETTRRYQSFHDMHSELHKLLGADVKLPSIPPKRISSGESTVAERKVGLETYLCALGAMTRGIVLPPLFKFIKPPGD